MTYFVSIKQSAVKALEKVEREDRLRIIDAIDQLKTNPTVGGVLKGEFPDYAVFGLATIAWCMKCRIRS